MNNLVDTFPPADDRPERAAATKPEHQQHRTIDRAAQILETVVSNPGMTFSEIVRSMDVAKSSMHGFVQGLLANGWLYEERGRFYLGPGIYGLTVASGQIQAGVVTNDDLRRLWQRTGTSVYFGIRAGDYLIYVSMAGDDPATDFHARSTIRRKLLLTAGGKAILAGLPASALNAYLRRQEGSEQGAVNGFLNDLPHIRSTRIAHNWTQNGTRFAIGSALRNRSGEVFAAITLVAPAATIQPLREELSTILLEEMTRLEANQTR